MSKYKKAVMEANIPSDLKCVYVTSSGIYASDQNNNDFLIMSSNDYKSPTTAFEKVCSFIDLKIRGES